MSTPPPVLTELKLSAQMKSAINAAFETGRAISIAYVDESGGPQLSYRGSTHAHSEHSSPSGFEIRKAESSSRYARIRESRCSTATSIPPRAAS